MSTPPRESQDPDWVHLRATYREQVQVLGRLSWLAWSVGTARPPPRLPACRLHVRVMRLRMRHPNIAICNQ